MRSGRNADRGRQPPDEESALSTSITIGVDAHKKTHALIAVDAVGRPLGEKTLPTSTEGHLAAGRWAGQYAVDGEVVRFAVEDCCRHLTRRL